MCISSKRVEAVWQKCYRQRCKVKFDVSKTTVGSIFPEEKRIFFTFLDIEQKTFCLFNKVFRPDCQTCSLRARWNTSGEKVQTFLHDFETLGGKLSTIWWNDSGEVAATAFLISRGKFWWKLRFLKKISVFLYLSQRISKNLFFNRHLSSGDASKAAFYLRGEI